MDFNCKPNPIIFLMEQFFASQKEQKEEREQREDKFRKFSRSKRENFRRGIAQEQRDAIKRRWRIQLFFKQEGNHTQASTDVDQHDSSIVGTQAIQEQAQVHPYPQVNPQQSNTNVSSQQPQEDIVQNQHFGFNTSQNQPENNIFDNQYNQDLQMNYEDNQYVQIPQNYQQPIHMNFQNQPYFHISPPQIPSHIQMIPSHQQNPFHKVQQHMYLSPVPLMQPLNQGPPEINHQIPPPLSQNMEFSFSKQFFIQSSNMNDFPQSPDQDQNNFFSQSILSNGQILNDSIIVQEKKIRGSAKNIFGDKKKVVGFEQKQISPFKKKEKIFHAHSAVKVDNVEEIKTNQESSYNNNFQYSAKNKKKLQEPPNSSGKRQKVQVQEKINPQKPKIDISAKKELIKRQESMKKDIIKKQNVVKKPQPKPINQENMSPLDRIAHQHKILKQYKHYIMFDKILGKGSFATVYLGINSVEKQKVAVKKMKISCIKQMCEVESLKELKHQNVITLYDYLDEKESQYCYLFLEFCDENLRQRLDSIAKDKLEQHKELQIRISYVEQLIEGMNVLNYKGFIHRDLKFQNILMKGDVLKIGDFGFCRRLNQKLEVQSVKCGTPYTMAPQIYFHPNDSQVNPTYTQKTDIFSLAVIFHELIYTTHPFNYDEKHLENLNRIDITGNQTILKKICSQYDIEIEWIEEIIDKGLKKFEERLTWEGLMEIYRNRNENKTKQCKSSQKERTKQAKKSEKNQESTDISMVEIIPNQTGQNKQEPKRKIIPQIVPEQIFYDSPIKQEQKDQPKYPKFPSRDISNRKKFKHDKPLERKQKFNIIEEAKRVFGDPLKSNLNKKNDNSHNNSRIISFDDEVSFVNKSKIQHSYQIDQNAHEADKSFKDFPTKLFHPKKITQNLNESVPSQILIQMKPMINIQNPLEQEKAGNKIFIIFATIVILWACVIIFERVFLGNPKA